MTRTVTKIIDSVATSDGAGVKLRRVIGSPEISDHDPFLLLDEFYSDNPDDYIAGFPSHPHRGFETLTYMIEGRMRHKDNKGNEGLLQSGGAQYMTAGKGIVHSEMPEQEEGLMRGLQLWINLPAVEKMTEARYLDINPDQIPETNQDGAFIRVVSGNLEDHRSPAEGAYATPKVLDVALEPGAEVIIDLDQNHNAVVYGLDGNITIAGETLQAGKLGILSEGDEITISSDEGARFVLISGRPLNEPVARYGPFVMNTRAELQQAAEDYHNGLF